MINYHCSIQRGNSFDCPEDSIWDDESEGDELIPEHVITEMEVADGVGFLECPACAHTYFLWAKIIEVCEHASYGYRAFAAMELESLLKDFPSLIDEIDLQDYEDLRTVRRVTRQWEDHLNHQQREASKRPHSS